MSSLSGSAKSGMLAAPKFADNLTRRASLNAVARALEYATRLIVNFFLKPFLVARLGAYSYGVWEVLHRFSGQFGSTSGHSSQALRSATANQQSSTDEQQKRRTLASAVSVWLLLLPGLTVASAVLAWWAPYWLKSPVELVWVVRVASFLLLSNVTLMGLVQIPRAALEGQNLGYKRMGISALLVVVGGGLSGGAVWFELGLVGVAAATIVTSLLNGALFLYVVSRHVTWFGFSTPSWSSIAGFFRLSCWFLGWQVVAKMMRASDVIILGLLTSAELVTVYSLTRYAPELALNLVAIIALGVMPGLGGIIGSNDLEKASRVRGDILALTWVIATATGCVAIAWNQSFLNLWVGPEYNAGVSSTFLMVLMSTQFALLRTDAQIIDLTLDLRQKVLVGVPSAALAVLLAILFVGPMGMGIEGVCAGIILGRLPQTILYPRIVGRHLGLPLVNQLQVSMHPTLLTLLVFALAWKLHESFVADSWLLLGCGVGVTLLLVSVPLMFLGVATATRQRLVRRLRIISSVSHG